MLQDAFAQAKNFGNKEYLKKERGSLAAGILGEITAPRDIQQLQYERRKLQAEYKLQGTELENATHLCKYYGGKFVKQAIYQPEVSITLMDDYFIEEIAEMSRLRIANDAPIVFHYDTTYNTGEYYVSTLSVRHDLLQHTQDSRRVHNPSPVIPVAFLIHQKKLKVNHQQFFQNVTRQLDAKTRGEFSATPKVLVSDQEFKTGDWGPTPVVHCWRHIIGDVTHYMKIKGKTVEDQKRAGRDCKNLLSSRSEQSFEDKLTNFLTQKEGPWAHKEFRRYFQRYTAPIILNSAGYWKLKDLRMTDIENGMTNNASEGANTALKSWTSSMKHISEGKMGRKIRTELYHTIGACKSYSDNEFTKLIMAGFNRSTEYEYKPQYADRVGNPDDMPELRVTDIVEDIREINSIIRGRRQGEWSLDGFSIPRDIQDSDHKNRTKGLQAAARHMFNNHRYVDQTASLYKRFFK